MSQRSFVRLRRGGPRGLAAVPTAVALLLSTAVQAEADPPDFTTVVGLPALRIEGQPSAGAVDLRLRTGGGQVVTEASLGLPPAGARFGAAVLTDDFDDDGDEDLIVGAPGAGTGRVAVLSGTGDGVSPATFLPLPASVRPGDEFGAALAVTFRRTPGPGPLPRDLWVGAPGHDVAGKADAGAVFRYVLSPTGTPAFLETITQDSPLVPGVAEPGDRFGSVLGGGGVGNGVAVGVPDEDIGRAADAGTVQRLRTDPSTDVLVEGEGFNQDAPGVHGVAEAGDRYGAALSGGGSYGGHAAGAPGEDIGGLMDAGAVQTFTDSGTPAGDFVPSAAYTQSTPGVPGVAEAGDRFGAALTVGDLACQDWSVTAAGSPGEDIGSAADAGSVTLLPDQRPARDCPMGFRQGRGLPGAAETGDQVGAALGVLKSDLAGAGEQYDRLQIGVPGEDAGNVRDAGRVITGTGPAATSTGHLPGDVAGLRFGSVLSTTG